jgi:hypothetical protein
MSWLINDDWLKTTLECSILLNIFSIFGDRCRSNNLDFTSCKCWLKEIGCIGTTFLIASTDDRMKLINEEDDISF